LIGSIQATLFCCLPAGIVAIVFAAQGKDQQARTWLIAAVVIGLVANATGYFFWFAD
jgi:Interferon-induced transmembrane protein